MEFTASNIITIAVYLLSIGVFVGTVKAQFKYLSLQISNLEKKVEKHNQVVERTYSIEKEIGIINEKMDVANHRIKDLEG